VHRESNVAGLTIADPTEPSSGNNGRTTERAAAKQCDNWLATTDFFTLLLPVLASNKQGETMKHYQIQSQSTQRPASDPRWFSNHKWIFDKRSEAEFALKILAHGAANRRYRLIAFEVIDQIPAPESVEPDPQLDPVIKYAAKLRSWKV
jgi:hypothetical protein